MSKKRLTKKEHTAMMKRYEEIQREIIRRVLAGATKIELFDYIGDETEFGSSDKYRVSLGDFADGAVRVRNAMILRGVL